MALKLKLLGLISVSQKLIFTCICILAISAVVHAQRMPGAQRKIEAPPEWVKVDEKSLFPELREGRWLVGVVSMGIETGDDRRLYTVLKVTHNYTGPDILIGQTFKVFSGNAIRGRNFQRAMKAGQKGVFAIQWNNYLADGAGLLISYGYGYAFLERQNRPILKDEYKQAATYAQSIERVAKAGRNEQIRLLAVYAKSPMPQRSAWSIRTLAQSGLEDAPRFLSDLVPNFKVPLQGQVALDESLAELDKDEWNFSSRRLDLWRRMMTSQATEEDAILVMSRLEDSLSQNELNRKTAQFPLKAKVFGLLKLGAANRKWTPDSRAYALSAIGSFARRKQIDRATAYAVLLPIFQSHPDLTAKPVAVLEKSYETQARMKAEATRDPAKSNARILANGALSGIAALKPFSPSQTAMLRASLSRAKDVFLASRLQRILGIKPLL